MNAGLAAAFPSALQPDVLVVLEQLPEPEHPAAATFRVKVDGEMVEIPTRIYHSPSRIAGEGLTALQRELLDCLLTRHYDGLIRQEHLVRVVRTSHTWVVPFVVQLLGEYVVQIIDVIQENLVALDRALYREFLYANPGFFALTAQRVTSYWDRYYSHYNRDEYAGFRVLEFFRSLLENP